MINIPADHLNTVFLPIVSTQLLLTICAYFYVVRSRILVNYRLYTYFLLSLAIFLIGRVLQLYSEAVLAYAILYIRVTILFSIGFPAMLIALARQCELVAIERYRYIPIIWGIFVSIVYVLGKDIGRYHIIVSADSASYISGFIGVHTARFIQVVGALTLGLLPSMYLFYRVWHRERNAILMAFVLGALNFSLLFSIGSYVQQSYWIYYAGSVITALCWSWAVFRHIDSMKGEAGAVIDELQYLIQSKNTKISPKLDRLLSQLESLSAGHIGVYKLRVKEIVNRLTEVRIQTGSDPQLALEVSAQQSQQIDKSDDTQFLTCVVRQAATEFSESLSRNRQGRLVSLVERTKENIQSHYQQKLDLDRLAEQVHVSRSYLMRVFKKSENITVHQYLTNLRIDHAKKLLEDHSVTDTAFAVGFDSANYFGSVFKKATGYTPSQYAKSIGCQESLE